MEKFYDGVGSIILKVVGVAVVMIALLVGIVFAVKATTSKSTVSTYRYAAEAELNLYITEVNGKKTYHITDDEGNELTFDSADEVDAIIQKKADEISARKEKNRAKRNASRSTHEVY